MTEPARTYNTPSLTGTSWDQALRAVIRKAARDLGVDPATAAGIARNTVDGIWCDFGRRALEFEKAKADREDQGYARGYAQALADLKTRRANLKVIRCR